jgi:hypothetical protein
MVTSSKGLGPEKEYAGEGQPHKQQTDPSSRQRGGYIRTMTAGVQLRKKNSGHVSQGARRQDELIGGKPPILK